MTRVILLLLLSLVVANLVAAHPHPEPEQVRPPLRVINDPLSHKNEPIERYTFDELDFYLHRSPNFLRWNDKQRVCESMRVLFGRMSAACYPQPVIMNSPTTTATVQFGILPYAPPHPKVLRVYPRYPVYSDVYRPHA